MAQKLLTTPDTADILGVPVATLYRWRYEGKGPTGFRVGRHTRYRPEDVEQYIEQQVQLERTRAAA